MSADFRAGYLSGALGIIIGNPLDLSIKVRLQAIPKPSTPSATPTPTPTPPTTTPHSVREALRGLPAPVLTYGALNALLFMSYNRSSALLPAAGGSTAEDGGGARRAYWSHFVAGAVGGLATFVISTPMELVKCRAQMQQSRSGQPVLSSWDIARQTFRRAGLAGLYEGGVVTAMRDAVGYGFYFLAYEAGKDAWDAAAVRYKGEDGTSWVHSEAVKVLLCGGVAGVATWGSIFPLDVIKTRVQTQEAGPPSGIRYAVRSNSIRALPPEGEALLTQSNANRPRKKGAVRIALDAYRIEGIAVFFRGMTVCCVRAFIVNAVQWAAYEYIMRLANAP